MRRPRSLGWVALWGLLAVGTAALAAGVLTAVDAPAVPGAAEPTQDPLVGPDYYASGAAVCGLLDSDDLAMATGRTYQEGFTPGISPAFFGIPGITKCAYLSEGAGAVETGVVYSYADIVFERAREYAEGVAGVRDVDGVGDAAFYALDELVVLADDHLVAVLFPGDHVEPDTHRLERARRLAATMIGRLR